MSDFGAAIPGQSLTTEPKAFPWERPPEIVDPEEAMQMHITKLSKPEALDKVLDLIEIGEMSINSVTQFILRSAVANGIYTIDVALIVAPVVHEFIKQAAQAMGIAAEDGFEDKKAKADNKKARDTQLARKVLKSIGNKPKEVVKEVKAMDTTDVAPVKKSRGLMAQGDM